MEYKEDNIIDMYEDGDVIDYECKYCKCKKAKISVSGQVVSIKYIICSNPKCGHLLDHKILGETGKQRPEWTTNAQCPYCHSYDTKKISSLSKTSSAALFGVFALGKITKQWHCNTCKSDF